MFSHPHKSNARQVTLLTLRTEACNPLMYMLYLFMHIHMQAAVTMPYSTNLKVTHILLGQTFVFCVEGDAQMHTPSSRERRGVLPMLALLICTVYLIRATI